MLQEKRPYLVSGEDVLGRMVHQQHEHRVRHGPAVSPVMVGDPSVVFPHRQHKSNQFITVVPA